MDGGHRQSAMAEEFKESEERKSRTYGRYRPADVQYELSDTLETLIAGPKSPEECLQNTTR